MISISSEFNFDLSPNPLKQSSVKWHQFIDRDVIPLWVADMDFASPPAVIEALQARVMLGNFGYALPDPALVTTIVEAMALRYGWTIDPSWIVWLPGLVCGLNVTARAFCESGEEALTFTPIYPPFLSAGKNAGRVVRPVSLLFNQAAGRWEIDWETLEQSVNAQTKLLLLCSPHNPVSRVWRSEELLRLGEFCLRHQLILCSDEIHCDLILDPMLKHTPTANLDRALANQTVTLMAPSKTYNVPGLGTAFAIIPNPMLRSRFNRAMDGIVPHVTSLGYVACAAAYQFGESWRQELLVYLRRNRDFLLDYIGNEIPGVKVQGVIEATYLAWLNVADLGRSDPIQHFEAFGVGLQEGANFGAPAAQFARMSFGCPLATLKTALSRLKAAALSV